MVLALFRPVVCLRFLITRDGVSLNVLSPAPVSLASVDPPALLTSRWPDCFSLCLLVWSRVAVSLFSDRCLSWIDSFLLSLTGFLLSLDLAGLGRLVDIVRWPSAPEPVASSPGSWSWYRGLVLDPPALTLAWIRGLGMLLEP